MQIYQSEKSKNGRVGSKDGAAQRRAEKRFGLRGTRRGTLRLNFDRRDGQSKLSFKIL